MADAPAGRAAPLAPGTVLEDGTRVGDYIGRSSGALNFFGEHPAAGRVAIKVLAPQLDAPLATMDDVFASLAGVRHVGVQSLISRGRIGPRSFLVYEYIDGQTLSAVISQLAESGRAVDRELVVGVVRSAAAALDVLHSVTSHGVLTASNLFLQRDGRLKIANPGYARLTVCAFGADTDEYRDSPYLAPEVRDDPWSATEASDIYSLGVVAVSLLAGRHLVPSEVAAAVADVCAAHPDLTQLLVSCVVEEPVMRLQSLRELHHLVGGGGGGGPAAAPEARVESDGFDALFGGVELPPVPALGDASAAAADPERWITSVGGRDFGPYTAEAIRGMLTRDEIDEHTTIVDVFTQETAALIDVPTFAEFTLDYLPERAKRRIAQEERRKVVVQTAKRTGTTTVVTGALATAAAFALAYALHVEKPPIPLADVVQPFPHTFQLDEPTYVEIRADDALIASLFDFSDPVPELAPSAGGPRRPRPDGTAAGDEPEPAEPSLDDYVVSFDSSRPASKLTVDDLNATLAANQSSIQLCFQRELRDNPDFRGVTVRLSIVPDGRTTNVRVDGRGRVSDDVQACLRRAFRVMVFPEFNDVPMNVSFPFQLQ
ncbi:MAG: AgmX/PglI C-terminal domain-containing protein [Myxococcales bacterium]|nr:AgmX/PglI C-terminal domain-containing protein [Myxococcales bacterium]